MHPSPHPHPLVHPLDGATRLLQAAANAAAGGGASAVTAVLDNCAQQNHANLDRGVPIENSWSHVAAREEARDAAAAAAAAEGGVEEEGQFADQLTRHQYQQQLQQHDYGEPAEHHRQSSDVSSGGSGSLRPGASFSARGGVRVLTDAAGNEVDPQDEAQQAQQRRTPDALKIKMHKPTREAGATSTMQGSEEENSRKGRAKKGKKRGKLKWSRLFSSS